jgi:hypothetical protein
MTSTRPAPGRIFISHRLEDAGFQALWLSDLLADHFGEDLVFRVVDSIPHGDDFGAEITAAVKSCDVLLVVIGNKWLTSTDKHGRRRIDIPDDVVRLEIEAALARPILVIPVLVDGAQMPRLDQLPPSLVELARRDALELRPNSFSADTGQFIAALEGTLAGKRTATGVIDDRTVEPARDAGLGWAGSAAPQSRPTPTRNRRRRKRRDIAPGWWASPPPSSQTGAYDDLVRRFFAEDARPGRLLFNPPDRMRLDQTERVEVRLTRTLGLDEELREHLRGHGEPQLEEIETAPLMAVTLRGDGFQITAYSDEEQRVTPDSITTWEFDIRAKQRGEQRLVLCVSLRIPAPGQPAEHKSIPVREATIYVQVGAPALVGHFVSDNWRWLIGTAIAIAAVVVAVLIH